MIGELFSEFIRFTIFVGFFWWLLINGDAFAISVINSLKQIAAEATGAGQDLSPSNIVDIGFIIMDNAISNSSIMSPIDGALGIILSLVILVVIALIAINMLILIISAWFLAYAGIFYLGFGGSKWTSDIAINFYRTVLSVAIQLFTMILLIGIGETILNQYHANITSGLPLAELGVILIVAITLLLLVDKIPSLLSGVITGSSVGSIGAGSFGAGAAVGAAAAAAGVASSMLSSTVKQAAGGASAIMAAASEANSTLSGNDTSFSGVNSATSNIGGDYSVPSPASDTSTNSTPYSEAAGFTSSIDASGREPDLDKTQISGSSNSNSQQSGFAGSVKKAGQFSVAATTNLVKGVGSVAKQKASEMKDNFQHDVSNTFGGKVASSIRANGSQKYSSDLESEIQSFVEKSG